MNTNMLDWKTANIFHLARKRCFGEHMAVETMVGQFVCSEEKLLNMVSNGCFQDYPNNIVQKDSTSIKAKNP